MAKITTLCLLFAIFVFVEDNAEALSDDLNRVISELQEICKQIQKYGNNWMKKPSHISNLIQETVEENKSLSKECVDELTTYNKSIIINFEKIKPEFAKIFKAVEDVKAWISGVQEFERISKTSSDEYESSLVTEGYNRLEIIKFHLDVELFNGLVPLTKIIIMNMSEIGYDLILMCAPKLETFIENHFF